MEFTCGEWVRQEYAYDVRDQLLAMTEDGKAIERYIYDKAGNMLKKTICGKTTTFTFVGVNQLAYGPNSSLTSMDVDGARWVAKAFWYADEYTDFVVLSGGLSMDMPDFSSNVWQEVFNAAEAIPIHRMSGTWEVVCRKWEE